LNCLSTDFYNSEAYPTYLYFNPYDETKEILFEKEDDELVDLYDALTHRVLEEGVSEAGTFSIQAGKACLIVAVPHRAVITRDDNKYWCNGKIIAYQ
jgi:hypothetical protein